MPCRHIRLRQFVTDGEAPAAETPQFQKGGAQRLWTDSRWCRT